MSRAPSIRLDPDCREAIVGHATRDYPREACGLLLGTARAADREVAAVLPIPNVASAPTRAFRLDEAEYLRGEKEARGRDLDVVGVYHSHPDGSASPSERDRGQGVPGWSYLVVGCDALQITSIRCWRLRADGSGFAEEALQTEL